MVLANGRRIFYWKSIPITAASFLTATIVSICVYLSLGFVNLPITISSGLIANLVAWSIIKFFGESDYYGEDWITFTERYNKAIREKMDDNCHFGSFKDFLYVVDGLLKNGFTIFYYKEHIRAESKDRKCSLNFNFEDPIVFRTLSGYYEGAAYTKFLKEGNLIFSSASEWKKAIRYCKTENRKSVLYLKNKLKYEKNNFLSDKRKEMEAGYWRADSIDKELIAMNKIKLLGMTEQELTSFVEEKVKKTIAEAKKR